MTESDLEQVLTWRNHPEVRRYMYTQHEISLEEHARWFAHASKNPAIHLLVFEIDNIPHGFIKIHKNKEMGNVAEWGFYVNPNSAKGTGRALGKAALQYAFKTVGLHKLCGQALAFNDQSIRFHLTLGFQREGILRQHHFDGHMYHDVVNFGILASELDSL